MYNGKYFSEVQKYCEDCKSGKIKANIYRIKAIDRFYRDLEDERYEFNPKDADLISTNLKKPFATCKAKRRKENLYEVLLLF